MNFYSIITAAYASAVINAKLYDAAAITETWWEFEKLRDIGVIISMPFHLMPSHATIIFGPPTVAKCKMSRRLTMPAPHYHCEITFIYY